MLLPFVLMPFFWGYDDGYMKRKGTEAHWPKFILFACIGYLAIMKADYLILLYWAIIWKPLFDTGWSIGAGYNHLLIGTTFFLDRWMHNLGLVDAENNKAPVLTMIYILITFIGCGLLLSELRLMI